MMLICSRWLLPIINAITIMSSLFKEQLVAQVNLLTVNGRQLSVAVYRETKKPYVNGKRIKLIKQKQNLKRLMLVQVTS